MKVADGGAGDNQFGHIYFDRCYQDRFGLRKVVARSAAAALLHTLADFPVHTDDAHTHFWPQTDWRFHSPISYWQRDNYGDIVGAVEMIVGVAIATGLIIKFQSWRIRLAAMACVVPYFISLGILF